MSRADDFLEAARKKGLITSTQGVNLDALGGSPVPDRALAVRSYGIEGQLPIAIFRQKCAAAKSERAFQDSIMEFAKFLGWRIAHFRPARVIRHGKETWETPIDGDGKGFLDLELVRERLVKIEAKCGNNKTFKEQDDWLLAYKQAGVEAYVFWPRDCEAIIHVLTRRKQ